MENVSYKTNKHRKKNQKISNIVRIYNQSDQADMKRR